MRAVFKLKKMKKDIITNKISPCCCLPFSIAYWWVSNLELNSQNDRKFILSQLRQDGSMSTNGWKTLINSGTLEIDANLTKSKFLEWLQNFLQSLIVKILH